MSRVGSFVMGSEIIIEPSEPQKMVRSGYGGRSTMPPTKGMSKGS